MGVRTVAVIVTGDTSSLRRALAEGTASVDKFVGSVVKGNATAAASFSTLGKAGAAGIVLVAAAMFEATKKAAEFESRMRNVNSLSHLSESSFKALSKATLELTTNGRIVQTANELADGLYQIASSGFQGRDGLTVLNQSAQAATAGMSTTSVAAKGIVAVLNAYGLSAASAKDVSDTLFQTVNVGVLTFEELSQQLGDFVGAAASLHVPIEDASSALATMTLAGISAAESATSLNQVFTAFIKPSGAMKTALHELGYESGVQALKVDGLHTVMERLRQITGGNISEIKKLFPEIRAARGAYALLANEGKNYNRVAGQIEDADKRQGATKRALDEQLKSTVSQLKLFRNEVVKQGIELGQHLLPPFTQLLTEVNRFGHEAGPVITHEVQVLTPLFRELGLIVRDVAKFLGEIVLVGGEVAGALGAIANAVVVPALTFLVWTLELLTKLLADNKSIAEVVAALYLGRLLTSILMTTAAWVAQEAALIGTRLGLAGLSIQTALTADGMKALAASILSVETVLTLGLGAALAVGIVGWNNYKKAQTDAASDIDKIKHSFDVMDAALHPEKATAAFGELSAAVRKGDENNKKYAGTLGIMKEGLDTIFHHGRIATEQFKAKDAQTAIAQLSAEIHNAATNAADLSMKTGLSVTEIEKLAKSQDIDLSKPFDESKDSRDQVLQYFRDLEKESGTSLSALSSAAGGSLEAIQALEKEVAALQKAASDAFTKDTDVLGSFDPTAGTKGLEAATGKVQKAEQALEDLRTRQSAHKKFTVSDAVSLQGAERRLNDAQGALAEQRAKRAHSTLEQAYRDAIKLGSNFERDISIATQRGLDPSVIAKLLQEGPKQAEPILQTILADSSGNLIKMVNDSEKQIARLNGIVVEQARLTALAVGSTTDQLGRDLGTAQKIALANFQSQGKATAESIAKSIGVPTAEVIRVATEFGITVATAVQTGMDSVNPTVNVAFQGKINAATAKKLDRLTRAEGGQIPVTAGRPGVDSVPALLMPKEYVQPVASVDYYGLGFMERIRNRSFPKGMAEGGLAGGVRYATTSNTTNSQSSYHEETNFNVGTVNNTDPQAMRGWKHRGRRGFSARTGALG